MTDRERDGLIGPVRSVQTKTIMNSAGRGGTDTSLLHSVYDFGGRKIQESLYHDGVLLVNTIFKYDRGGNLLEAADYDREALVGRRLVYVYDASGRLAEWINYTGSGRVGRKGTFRDINGIRIERISGGACAGKEVLTYDDSGNRTDLGVYAVETARAIESVYDVSANPAKITFYDAEELPLRELRLLYDHERKLVEIADFCSFDLFQSDPVARRDDVRGPDLFLRRTFLYNSDRQKIEESVYNAEDSLVEKGIFAYDSEGRLIQETEYSSDGEIRHKEVYSRDLDPSGNWVKEILLTWDSQTDDFNTFHTAERIIQYY